MSESGSNKRVERFPKAARLLKRSEFRFKPYQKFSSRHFDFYFTDQGKGRVGISISKKVLKSAVARNRVKRMVRESFRKMRTELPKVDVHVMGRSTLTENWENLKTADVNAELRKCLFRS